MVYRGSFNSGDLLKYKPADDGSQGLSFAELMELNPDVCAWITIDDTHVDYPVVQGEDDNEYINKNVYGEFALSGSIFLSCLNNRDFSDSYNLLYGHHMDGGAMFGDIARFTDYRYFDRHRTGTLYLPGRTAQIELFACVKADAYDTVIFHPDAQPRGDVSSLLEHIDNNAVCYRDIKLDPGDYIIGLSTCSEAETNGRIILFGRLNYNSGGASGLEN